MDFVFPLEADVELRGGTLLDTPAAVECACEASHGREAVSHPDLLAVTHEPADDLPLGQVRPRWRPHFAAPLQALAQSEDPAAVVSGSDSTTGETTYVDSMCAATATTANSTSSVPQSQAECILMMSLRAHMRSQFLRMPLPRPEASASPHSAASAAPPPPPPPPTAAVEDMEASPAMQETGDGTPFEIEEPALASTALTGRAELGSSYLVHVSRNAVRVVHPDSGCTHTTFLEQLLDTGSAGLSGGPSVEVYAASIVAVPQEPVSSPDRKSAAARNVVRRGFQVSAFLCLAHGDRISWCALEEHSADGWRVRALCSFLWPQGANVSAVSAAFVDAPHLLHQDAPGIAASHIAWSIGSWDSPTVSVLLIGTSWLLHQDGSCRLDLGSALASSDVAATELPNPDLSGDARRLFPTTSAELCLVGRLHLPSSSSSLGAVGARDDDPSWGSRSTLIRCVAMATLLPAQHVVCFLGGGGGELVVWAWDSSHSHWSLVLSAQLDGTPVRELQDLITASLRSDSASATGSASLLELANASCGMLAVSCGGTYLVGLTVVSAESVQIVGFLRQLLCCDHSLQEDASYSVILPNDLARVHAICALPATTASLNASGQGSAAGEVEEHASPYSCGPCCCVGRLRQLLGMVPLCWADARGRLCVGFASLNTAGTCDGNLVATKSAIDTGRWRAGGRFAGRIISACRLGLVPGNVSSHLVGRGSRDRRIESSVLLMAFGPYPVQRADGTIAMRPPQLSAVTGTEMFGTDSPPVPPVEEVGVGRTNGVGEVGGTTSLQFAPEVEPTSCSVGVGPSGVEEANLNALLSSHDNAMLSLPAWFMVGCNSSRAAEVVRTQWVEGPTAFRKRLAEQKAATQRDSDFGDTLLQPTVCVGAAFRASESASDVTLSCIAALPLGGCTLHFVQGAPELGLMFAAVDSRIDVIAWDNDHHDLAETGEKAAANCTELALVLVASVSMPNAGMATALSTAPLAVAHEADATSLPTQQEHHSRTRSDGLVVAAEAMLSVCSFWLGVGGSGSVTLVPLMRFAGMGILTRSLAVQASPASRGSVGEVGHFAFDIAGVGWWNEGEHGDETRAVAADRDGVEQTESAGQPRVFSFRLCFRDVDVARAKTIAESASAAGTSASGPDSEQPQAYLGTTWHGGLPEGEDTDTWPSWQKQKQALTFPQAPHDQPHTVLRSATPGVFTVVSDHGATTSLRV